MAVWLTGWLSGWLTGCRAHWLIQGARLRGFGPGALGFADLGLECAGLRGFGLGVCWASGIWAWRALGYEDLRLEGAGGFEWPWLESAEPRGFGPGGRQASRIRRALGDRPGMDPRSLAFKVWSLVSKVRSLVSNLRNLNPKPLTGRGAYPPDPLGLRPPTKAGPCASSTEPGIGGDNSLKPGALQAQIIEVRRAGSPNPRTPAPDPRTPAPHPRTLVRLQS